ncbi:uncharacterized protein LOC142451513 [Tenrec ecaudatus]|uniref:uncharacterized protein LOC142451513 n=1 Tax=Tenrec ecaudatus TaxID=94439 RepID=UPI003F5A0AD6
MGPFEPSGHSPALRRAHRLRPNPLPGRLPWSRPESPLAPALLGKRRLPGTEHQDFRKFAAEGTAQAGPSSASTAHPAGTRASIPGLPRCIGASLRIYRSRVAPSSGYLKTAAGFPPDPTQHSPPFGSSRGTLVGRGDVRKGPLPPDSTSSLAVPPGASLPTSAHPAAEGEGEADPTPSSKALGSAAETRGSPSPSSCLAHSPGQAGNSERVEEGKRVEGWREPRTSNSTVPQPPLPRSRPPSLPKAALQHSRAPLPISGLRAPHPTPQKLAAATRGSPSPTEIRAPGAATSPAPRPRSHLAARVGAFRGPPPRRPRGLRPAGRQSRGPSPCPRVPAVPPAVGPSGQPSPPPLLSSAAALYPGSRSPLPAGSRTPRLKGTSSFCLGTPSPSLRRSGGPRGPLPFQGAE